MDKKKRIVKSLIQSLIGIPVGIMALIISYVLIYLIGSEELYITNIRNLENINILSNQLLSIGVLYYSLFMFYNILEKIRKDDEIVKKQPIKTTMILMVSVAALIMVFYNLLELNQSFSLELIYTNTFIFTFVLSSCIIASCSNILLEKGLVKKINDKLKERNR